MAANRPARAAVRTLAGATILQVVPSLGNDLAGNAALDIAVTLVQAGARAILAGDGGPPVGALRAFGGAGRRGAAAVCDAGTDPPRDRRARRKWVLEHFNPQTLAEQTLGLYECFTTKAP